MKTWKDRVKSNYSDIRGVHHGPRPEKTIEQLDRELSYADRLNVNSIRMGGMTEEQWHDDPKGVEKRILDYTRLCAKHGITVMPVLSSGNGIKNYEMLTEAQWNKKRRYLEAMVNLLKPEPNLLIWDVYNEPFCNDYLRGAPKDEYETRFKKIEHDLRKQFEIMRELDDDTPMTVGHELAEHLESTLDLVDVIAFHDYLRTRKAVGETYEYARQCSIRTGGKPVINNEMGCIGRANPYDVELQFCEQYHYGFYIFCLMIEGFWGPLHGIVYPDGTVRDPSIVAAMFGFYRNRGKSRILPQGNREEYASDAIERVKRALAVDKQSLFTKFEAPTEEILEAAENCVNILESCEIVPMDNLLSAQLQELRDDPDVESRRADIKRFAYDMAKKLQEYYCLF